ncbi:hypothetical protein [uncultured Psychroserpens sp.]|uniref:hypothetical protein n=1 Tax=uncultured Psychroserpens sp. TaxID=255436 RepID=UPI0026384C03|nr:hypothetical protein [uncultured Psychroserpens sp.]
MQATITNELPCSVFGHNLERSSSGISNSNELFCKTCNSKVAIDAQGEFQNFPIQNRSIKVALRQLFLLGSQYSRKQLSV